VGCHFGEEAEQVLEYSDVDFGQSRQHTLHRLHYVDTRHTTHDTQSASAEAWEEVKGNVEGTLASGFEEDVVEVKGEEGFAQLSQELFEETAHDVDVEAVVEVHVLALIERPLEPLDRHRTARETKDSLLVDAPLLHRRRTKIISPMIVCFLGPRRKREDEEEGKERRRSE
jgi:hypothetical protein